MINGVLTERTVKEVAPMVKTNLDGLKKTLEELVKQYKSKQDEMEKWKVRFSHSPWVLIRPPLPTEMLTPSPVEEEQCPGRPTAGPVMETCSHV
jgi:hypothetical protein